MMATLPRLIVCLYLKGTQGCREIRAGIQEKSSNELKGKFSSSEFSLHFFSVVTDPTPAAWPGYITSSCLVSALCAVKHALSHFPDPHRRHLGRELQYSSNCQLSLPNTGLSKKQQLFILSSLFKLIRGEVYMKGWDVHKSKLHPEP